MARTELNFDQDQISQNFTVTGTVYIDYATGMVYADATGNAAGYIDVKNDSTNTVSTYDIAKFATPTGGYKLVFGDPSGNKVVVTYTGQQPGSATISYHHGGHVTTGTNQPVMPCYCTGTRVKTARGDVAVENLVVGDMVCTAAGGTRPVTWIGRRHLDLTRHANPRAVYPVRVSAGAFADNLPVRDLWMSPGHNVFIDGVLMPVRVLINGVTVSQVSGDEVTYWHVELDSHDVILAEGLPAEPQGKSNPRRLLEREMS